MALTAQDHKFLKAYYRVHRGHQKNFKIEVNDGTFGWVPFNLDFSSREKAESYAEDLFRQFSKIAEWRVVEIEK